MLKEIIHIAMWNLGLSHYKWLPKKIRNELMDRHCSIACQRVHEMDGGMIVYTVRDIQEAGKVQDHFMNISDKFPNEIYDLFGNSVAIKNPPKVGDKIDFGNGTYTIVDIKKEFEEFGIHSVSKLMAYTKAWASKIQAGQI